MTRDKAEEIVSTVEVGMGDYYGISLTEYLEAVSVLDRDDVSPNLD